MYMYIASFMPWVNKAIHISNTLNLVVIIIVHGSLSLTHAIFLSPSVPLSSLYHSGCRANWSMMSTWLRVLTTCLTLSLVSSEETTQERLSSKYDSVKQFWAFFSFVLGEEHAEYYNPWMCGNVFLAQADPYKGGDIVHVYFGRYEKSSLFRSPYNLAP